MKRVMLTDEPGPRRRAVIDDDDGDEPIPPARPSARTLDITTPETVSRFGVKALDPFDLTHPVRVPTDVARLASRFSHEAVAALRLEMHTKTGRARTAAAQQLLALALHAPDAAVIEQVETLSEEALDAQLGELLQAEGIEEMLAQFGFVKARSESELRRVRAIVNRPRGTVA
jgi:hypothetical protein